MRRGAALVIALLAACGGDDAPGPGGEGVGWLAEVEGHGIDARHTATDPVVGGALLVGDVDQDGLPDVLVGTGSGVRAYRNLGGLGFEERTDAWGLSGLSASAMALGRLDDDARADLVLASSDGIRLLSGTGDGFTDATAGAGLGGVSVEQPVHVLPADFDRDGLVDLYVSSYGGADLVLRARGDGAFEDVTDGWGMAGEGHTWTASWFDQDGNGAPDLYVATDTFEEDLGERPEWSEERRAPGDRLYRNGGWDADGTPMFEEVSAVVRLDTPRSSMGGLVTDLDEDGTLDLLITDFGRNHALSPGSDGTFAYRTAELALDRAERADLEDCPPAEAERPTTRCALVSWGAFHRDFDGDGFGDRLVVNGGLEPDERGPEPLSAYRGGPDGLEEVRLSTEPVFGRASAVADLDGDDDPDLAVLEWNGLLRLFENVAGARSRLVLNLEGPAHGRGAGAVVRLELPEGDRVRAAGSGGLAQAQVYAPLSVSAPSGVSRVEVRWPSGHVQAGEPAGASMRIVHPPRVRVDARVVPADGTSEVVVTAEPGGDASSVTVELVGIGEASEAESLGDGLYRATLVAPAAPARATVIVRVDGEPLGTRPRILFE